MGIFAGNPCPGWEKWDLEFLSWILGRLPPALPKSPLSGWILPSSPSPGLIFGLSATPETPKTERNPLQKGIFCPLFLLLADFRELIQLAAPSSASLPPRGGQNSWDLFTWRAIPGLGELPAPPALGFLIPGNSTQHRKSREAAGVGWRGEK